MEGDLVVSSDGTLHINSANIISADNIAYNGIIHVIDQLLIPPLGSCTMPCLLSLRLTLSSIAALLPIPQAMSLIPELGYMLTIALISDAGLAQLFQGAGPYTVFAVSDLGSAKAAIPEELRLESDPARLRQVLLYHVVPGRYPLSSLRDGMHARQHSTNLIAFSQGTP